MESLSLYMERLSVDGKVKPQMVEDLRNRRNDKRYYGRKDICNSISGF